MFGKVAKTAVTTKAGREATKAGVRGVFGAGRGLGRAANTKAGRSAGKAGVKGFGRFAKVAATTKAGKKGAKGAAKAGRGFGKSAIRRGGGSSGESSATRLIKYALFALGGFAVGRLVARSGSNGSTSFTDTGTGPDLQRPEEANRTGSERGYSDPSEGPLVGESHRTHIEGVPEEQHEVEQRIRTRIGEDERTRELPHVNVEVIDGVAELRGVAPSEEAKDAAGEIAAEVEGVREVRNLITVES